MKGYIYLIESIKTNKRYLGSTHNPNSRIKEHNRGKCETTKNGIPWVCLLIINVGTIEDAKKIEYYIKQQKEKHTIENVIKALNRYYSVTSTPV